MDGHQTERHELWIWVARDAKTKFIPVLLLLGRTQAAVYQVVHELKHRLTSGCIPVFSPDGMKAYFYVLTAYFGKWEIIEGKQKPVWVLLNEFIYSRVARLRCCRKLSG